MPDLWLHAIAALAAGFGAVARFTLDGAVSSAVARRAGAGGSLPWGTLIVNLSGSLLIGVVAGLAIGLEGVGGGAGAAPVGGLLPAHTWPVAAALGALGGYTTFSTASHQTVRLVRERRWMHAAANGVGQLILAVAFAGLGWWIAAALVA